MRSHLCARAGLLAPCQISLGQLHCMVSLLCDPTTTTNHEGVYLGIKARGTALSLVRPPRVGWLYTQKDRYNAPSHSTKPVPTS